ncbi:MAG TPA: TolC family protein [Terracidiphilus sp.]|jgi:outer membrane protein|nr:TolC family protein [Terracidiphilus sp.]
MTKRLKIGPLLTLLACALPIAGQQHPNALSLPDAPDAHLIAWAAAPPAVAEAQNPTAPSSASTDNAPRLTRNEAEQMALKNNPRISVSRLLALAQHQAMREARAAALPTSTASVTAVDAEDGSRVSAGSLTASRLFERAGAGANVSQLITDFGRTGNLISSAKLEEKAQNANAMATANDIVIATDQAFYDALQAQAVYQVAKQNVDTRQTTDTQIGQLTRNKLKSTLDLSFADVNLSQAKLLMLNTQNELDASMAILDAVLGLDKEVRYSLVDDTQELQPPPDDVDKLVQAGLTQRPDLQALSFDQQSAVRFSHAQRDQMLPSITAAGTLGSVPIRPAEYYTANWWGGVGVNLNIPVFNGFLYSAQAKEASLRAQAAGERSRDLRNQIVRDVHTAWLAAKTAYQRVAVTQQMLQQANLSLQLAQTRYKIGLSSIVELSQAQYLQTEAAIGNTNAAYQYRLALATLNYQIGSMP